MKSNKTNKALALLEVLAALSIIALLAFAILLPPKTRDAQSKTLATGRVAVYDNCEYVFFGFGNNETCAHKGNCRFCEERHKQGR